MGAAKFKARIKDLGLGIEVAAAPVDNVPADAQIIVTHESLAERAKAKYDNVEIIEIKNFLKDENIEIMKKQGKVVLLTATPEVIYDRVKNSNTRPILNENMSIEYIANLIENRKDKYLKAADIIVDTDNKSLEEICEEIINNI